MRAGLSAVYRSPWAPNKKIETLYCCTVHYTYVCALDKYKYHHIIHALAERELQKLIYTGGIHTEKKRRKHTVQGMHAPHHDLFMWASRSLRRIKTQQKRISTPDHYTLATVRTQYHALYSYDDNL